METKKKTYVLTVSKVFLKGHPRAGQPTNFRQLILEGKKIHTIRAGEYWRKVAEEVNAGNAVLSVRDWIGRPYNSKQDEFLRLEKMGWQETMVLPYGDVSKDVRIRTNAIHEGSFSSVSEKYVAANDGLAVEDFRAWFGGSLTGGIIHFTDFRY
ncbi:MAG TPA: hypothetical protein VNQ80_15355 [Parapedobacter sp.]|uniref:hypothetical protein n=1 Tax=Parapedobacter sp. TaxID=1958893 RepID=UPI002D16B759|nr:hypothetical protein [Parapedobacter sp.]HWK58719.1 hypothetical protein [Parapedobacter sp.]